MYHEPLKGASRMTPASPHYLKLSYLQCVGPTEGLLTGIAADTPLAAADKPLVVAIGD